MSNSRLEQIGAAGGIVFVVLQMASQALIQAGGAEPPFDATTETIVTFFLARNSRLFALGEYLSTLSLIAFLWFLGSLWSALRRAESEPAWLSFVAAASGLMIVATVSAGSGWPLAVFRQAEGLDPQIVRLLFDQGNFAFANAWVMLASLSLATGVASIRTGALPGWLGWAGVTIAVGLLAARRLGQLRAGVRALRLVLSLANRDQYCADASRWRGGEPTTRITRADRSMNRTDTAAHIAGAVAGIAGLLIFLVIHAFWIVPIWFILPIGLLVASTGGLAVGWAYAELRWRLPPRPWTALAVVGVIAVILLPAFVLAELQAPVFIVTPAGPVQTVATSIIVARFVGELLATATIVGGLVGWWLGRTRRAALATAVAGFIFALGPGHNIPFIGGTPGVRKELAIMAVVIGISALALVEVHDWLTRRSRQ
jgi:hypothetical protein